MPAHTWECHFPKVEKKPSNLLAIGVSLPKGDTVLLRHVPALRQHLEVLQHALALETHAQVKTVGTLCKYNIFGLIGVFVIGDCVCLRALLLHKLLGNKL